VGGSASELSDYSVAYIRVRILLSPSYNSDVLFEGLIFGLAVGSFGVVGREVQPETGSSGCCSTGSVSCWSCGCSGLQVRDQAVLVGNLGILVLYLGLQVGQDLSHLVKLCLVSHLDVKGA
jgi:hypothetical protein